mmetsp:Transcript_43668/g.78397  ORF Transcript_43668/g.78397 Transcript_43668/m.78397 type:complete len:621 (-) Transcript_43668:231-2093(-)
MHALVRALDEEQAIHGQKSEELVKASQSEMIASSTLNEAKTYCRQSSALSSSCTEVFFTDDGEIDMESAEQPRDSYGCQGENMSFSFSHCVISFNAMNLVIWVVTIIACVAFRHRFFADFVNAASADLEPFEGIQEPRYLQTKKVFNHNTPFITRLLNDEGEIIAERLPDLEHGDLAKDRLTARQLHMDETMCSAGNLTFIAFADGDVWHCLKTVGWDGKPLTIQLVVRGRVATVFAHLFDTASVLRKHIIFSTGEAAFIMVFLCLIMCSVCIGFCLSFFVVKRFDRLHTLAQQTATEFTATAGSHSRKPDDLAIRIGAGSTSREVLCEFEAIQDSLVHMSNGIRSLKKYHDPMMAKVLMHSKPELKMADAEVTVLFSDIAGFTSIAEMLTPQELLHVLRAYFEEMGSVIVESKGVVGDFIGDGIMAWWNTPVDLGSSHTLIALNAALEQQQRLKDLNQSLQSKSLPDLQVRMGLVRGKVLAGNLGCSDRMKFGLIGDPVNLASRLEALCKTYNVKILIDKSVVEAPGVMSSMLFRPVDLVTVRGRSAVTEVFELVGHKKPQNAAAKAFCYEFTTIQEHYRSQNFTAALQQLKRFRAKWPQDKAAEMIAERCARLASHDR